VIVLKCIKGLRYNVNCPQCQSESSFDNGIKVIEKGNKNITLLHPIKIDSKGDLVTLSDLNNSITIYLKNIVQYNTINKLINYINLCNTVINSSNSQSSSVNVNLYDNSQADYTISGSFVSGTGYVLEPITNLPDGLNLTISNFSSSSMIITVTNNSGGTYLGTILFNINS